MGGLRASPNRLFSRAASDNPVAAAAVSRATARRALPDARPTIVLAFAEASEYLVPDVSQTAETPSLRVEPDDVRQQLAGKHACPFCGVIRADAQQPCPRCTMEDTGATRGATRQRIGPWFVLQARNPSAPGMKFATLLQLVRKGHVTPRSIVRGPTSQQLWTFAVKLRGLSREFGLCCHCGENVEPNALTCGQCGYSQDLPANPDTLFEPAEVTPPDLMQAARSPADTGMDGGTSLDLQVSDVSAAAAAPAATNPPIAPIPLKPAPASPAPAQQTNPVAGRPVAVPRPTNPSALPAVARRPDRPASMTTMPPASEGILSARELAAAFQLDFKPKGEKTSPSTTGGLPNPNRKGSLLRTIFFFLLIMLASATITLLLRPDWRKIVFDAANAKFVSVKKTLETPVSKSPSPGVAKTPSAAPVTVPPKPVPVPAPVPAPNTAVVAEPVPSTNAPKPTPAAPVDTLSPALAPEQIAELPAKSTPAPVPIPTPAPAAELPAPPAAEPTPEPAAVATPVPAPAPVFEPPTQPLAPAPTPPAPTPLPVDNTDIDSLTLDQAVDKASQWRNQAIDAGARGDWAGAVSLYERIEKLPKDAWPSDVELKLEIARKRARG